MAYSSPVKPYYGDKPSNWCAVTQRRLYRSTLTASTLAGDRRHHCNDSTVCGWPQLGCIFCWIRIRELAPLISPSLSRSTATKMARLYNFEPFACLGLADVLSDSRVTYASIARSRTRKLVHATALGIVEQRGNSCNADYVTYQWCPFASAPPGSLHKARVCVDRAD